MSTKSALDVDRVVVVRGGVSIVRGVSFSISAGEITGLFGASGAGKSTLFGAISGELPLREGRVLLDGHDVSREPMWKRARRGLGYVPQTPSVLFDLTVRENLLTFAKLAEVAPRIDEWSRDVELSSRLDVRAGSLSGGERRRLELGRALVSSRRVLLCDEPLSGLNPSASAHLLELLKARASNGLAILLSDHRLEQALTIVSRAHLLVDGAIDLTDDARSFASREEVRRSYLSNGL